MKKISTLFLSLAGVTALAAVGCSSSSDGTGTAGTGGGNPNAIVPSGDGFVDGTNTFGILGAWYSYGDSYKMDAVGDCQTAGFPVAMCSSMETPAFGAPFTNTGGKMCAKGIAALTANTPGGTTPAYAAIWGAGIGLDFNNAGLDGGTGKNKWDATAHNVTGFSFDLDKLPAIGGQMRVEFPASSMSGNDAAFWSGAANNLSSNLKAGTNTIKWADVGGPMYLTNPPAFNPANIYGIQFHVVSNTSSATPFEFCISNLTPLTN